MTTETVLANKNVVVVGLGLTGRSCVEFLLSQGAKVTAMDTRENLVTDFADEVNVILGPLDPKVLSQAELILLSPGLPLALPEIQLAIAAGVEVIGDIELFARFNTRPVLAITGSNGKSTVTMLLADMLKAAGKKVAVGGNIGTPALSLLQQNADVVVLELSSFQLETTSSLHPLAATVLNISDDHMDRYQSSEDYRQAKLRIYRNAETVISNRDDAATSVQTQATTVTFGLSASDTGFAYNTNNGDILLDGKAVLNSHDCRLVGMHNVMNIQAALALFQTTGADLSSVVESIKDFVGLEHRCQWIADKNGVRWINDSKATNVGATQAAISGLKPQVQGQLWLIAGGDGKGADFSPLKALFQDDVAGLITLGKDGPALAKLKSGSLQVKTLSDAVNTAAQNTSSGDMVLLSPACASLDMFANYQQRGEEFAALVRDLS